ncbi:MAG TPA: hypothetical protein GX002_05275 [Clostridiales bacterium]|nr:hypothetical protein [Clostridiales bacterium]
MKKAFYLLIIIILLLTGCQGNQEGFAKKSEGVYYHKINPREITQRYNPGAIYACGLFHYNDRMYTSSQIFHLRDKNNLNLDNICEEELGTVYGNRQILWSTDKDELSKATDEGILYQVKGYDETFRIAVYYESLLPLSDTIIYSLMIFDSLNDITLHKGSDLFGDRFNLKDSVYIEGYFVKDQIDYEISSKHELSIEDKIIDDFLTELYKGVFLDPASEEYPKLKARPSYVLSFQDAIGLVTDILVYEEGYAALNQAGVDEMIVNIEAKVCKDIIDIILSSQ